MLMKYISLNRLVCSSKYSMHTKHLDVLYNALHGVFWPSNFLLQRELKLNLESFANRVVNVSFAVATTRGLSEYSPATTTRVPRGKPHNWNHKQAAFNLPALLLGSLLKKEPENGWLDMRMCILPLLNGCIWLLFILVEGQSIKPPVWLLQ